MAKKPTSKEKKPTNSSSNAVSHDFSADVGQLIKLVTHSMYSTREIFLRELIANANDAIQKAKILSLQEPGSVGELGDLEIRVAVDEEKKIITLTDTGIGMDSDDMIRNLGTIANSGTKAFLQQMAEKKTEKQSDEPTQKNNDLVGQFGIGFYSVFMVADSVSVESKKHNHDAVIWTSAGEGHYDITPGTRTDRGTTITITLKDDAAEFATHAKLKAMVKKHSNYIPTAIYMNRKDKDGKVEKDHREQINAMQAIWTKQKSAVTNDEYQEFWKTLSRSQDEPLDIIHIHTEGALSYKCLLYIPVKKPAFMIEPEQADARGPNLYVQNVLIMEKCKHLLPNRLRFVKGVVETNDVDLNVSREILQDSPVIQKLQQSLVKEVMKSLLWKKKKEPDAYKTFFEHYGRVIKEGMANDFANREKLLDLALFYNKETRDFTGLDGFIADSNSESTDEKKDEKKDGEKEPEKSAILYLVGSSIDELHQSPYAAKHEGQPMIFITDPIDEYVLQQLREYKGHPFKMANDAKLFTDDAIDLGKEQKNLLSYLQGKLSSQSIEKIEYSTKLSGIPAMIVQGEEGQSVQMQKVMKAMGHAVQEQKKTLLLNPEHALVKKLEALHADEPTSNKTEALARFLADQATMIEGGDVTNINDFFVRINTLLS